uniref:hypothetical protein n=1 Tax=Collinsella aerofaciens TaxID=74426 RepID=UPI00359C3627
MTLQTRQSGNLSFNFGGMTRRSMPPCFKAPCSLWRVFAVGAITSALLWLSEMIRWGRRKTDHFFILVHWCIGARGQVSFAPVSVESVLLAGCPYNGLRMNRNQGVPVYGPEPF